MARYSDLLPDQDLEQMFGNYIHPAYIYKYMYIYKPFLQYCDAMLVPYESKPNYIYNEI